MSWDDLNECYPNNDFNVQKQVAAIELIKTYFLSENIFIKSRGMRLGEDQALDEYLMGLLKQGNTLYATTEDDNVAGFCVNFASNPVDPKNLRNFAYYRQDPDIKDFLCYMAALEETPNLWTVFNQRKIFEIKMLAVLPEFRRQGLGGLLTEMSKELANDQGYKVVRMNCINNFDYKVAERCMLQCIAKFPLHKLRSTTAPFIKKNSEFNRMLRVYVGVDTILNGSQDNCELNLDDSMKMCKTNLEECLQ